MKRKILLFVLLLSSVMVAACKLNDSDDRNSFTKVDVSRFIKGNKYVFPKGTSALELYNTFISKHTEGEYTVTGTYTITETAILLGKVHKEEITKNIQKVKIYRSKTELSNCFHVDFITNENKVLENYYSWQHHLSNVWHNNEIDGDITIPMF